MNQNNDASRLQNARQTKTEAKREQQEQEREMVMEKEVLATEWGETRTKDQRRRFWIR